MLVLLSWLNDYLDKKIDYKDETVVKDLILTMDNLGLVTESVSYVGDDLEGVVLARILEINPIKDRDKIRQVFVDAGSYGSRVEVVCGAWNFQVGDVVAFATTGTALPNGMVIAERKMGGVTSNGMLCSKKELGLGEDHQGIDVVYSPTDDSSELPAGLRLGMSYAEYLGFGKDVLLDIAVEPNRPDCLSMYGIARDIAPQIGAKLVFPEVKTDYSSKPNPYQVSVTIEDDEACDHFAIQVVDNIKVTESSRKIAYRLSMAGMRPINSVVDASNYVMLELGRPSHPYDMNYLLSNRSDAFSATMPGSLVGRSKSEVKIDVRWARDGESLVTIDGKERSFDQLDKDREEAKNINLVIADDSQVLAVAGVMGGIDSEVGTNTTSILLEVADFNQRTVLRTSRAHQLRSEASLRFERGIDPSITVLAGERICQLLSESAKEHNVSLPIIWPMHIEGKRKRLTPRKLTVSLSRISAVLAKEFNSEEIAALLEPIGFIVESEANDSDLCTVSIPAFRPDVEREIDVVEEIARHYGYENFPKTLPRSNTVGKLNEYQEQLRVVRATLAGLKACEAWTNPLVDKNTYPLPRDLLIGLANPLTAEENALRSSILPSLLVSLKRNGSYRNPYIRLFEIGHIFTPQPGASSASLAKTAQVADYVEEKEELCCLFAGSGDDARQAYQAFLTLVQTLKIDPSSFELLSGDNLDEDESGFFHPSRSKKIVSVLDTKESQGAPHLTMKDAIGAVGELHPYLGRLYGIENQRVAVLILDMAKLFALKKKPLEAVLLSMYPSSDIDLCFIADQMTTAREIEAVLREAAGTYLESIRLIDSYENRDNSLRVRSLTFRLRLANRQSTFTEEELRGIWNDCVKAVSDRLHIKLREN